MKAVILAAGVGSRLGDLTKSRPKALLPVGNSTILETQLKSLFAAGAEEVIVVAGYLSRQIQDRCRSHENVTVVENTKYNVTNNMYSLSLALKDRNHGDGLLVLNGDVVCDPEIISNLLGNPFQNLIAAKKGEYNPESMKIIVKNDRVEHISKTIPREESYGISLDIYKLGCKAVDALKNSVRRIIEVEGNRNAWTEVALDEIFGAVEFMPLDMRFLQWCEIDTLEDLITARGLF